MPSFHKQCTINTASTSRLHKTDSKNKARNRRRNRKKHKLSLLNKFVKVPQQHQRSITHSHNINKFNQNPVLYAADKKQSAAATRCCPTTAWTKIYNSAVSWQYQYQTDFWKSIAHRRQQENEELRQRVEMLEASLSSTDTLAQSTNVADENESFTSLSDEESETQESFLTFMEISTRHQIQKQLEQQELDRTYE